MLIYADHFQVIKHSIKTRLRLYLDTFPATECDNPPQKPDSTCSNDKNAGVTCLQQAKDMFNNMLLPNPHIYWKTSVFKSCRVKADFLHIPTQTGKSDRARKLEEFMR